MDGEDVELRRDWEDAWGGVNNNYVMSEALAAQRIERLSDFNELQGLSLTGQEAGQLCELQQEFITSSLKDGFGALDKVESGETSESVFDEHIKAVKELIENSRQTNELKADSADELLAYYEIIHCDAALDDRQKLFLEFLLGLGFVDINIKIGLETAKIMADRDASGVHFDAETKAQLTALEISNQAGEVVAGLRQSSDIAYQIGDKMQELFGSDPEQYWLLVMQALKTNPELEALAKKVVSMRYIPEETEMLGIAQALHWSGWGGDGSVMRQIPQLNDPKLLRHTIAWHGGDKDGSSPHFAKRMALFAAMIQKIKQREAEALAEVVRAGFSQREELRIFDAGAGPVARGSANWIARSLQGDFGKIVIDAGEVDGRSLKSLVELKGKKPLPDLQDNVEVGDVVRLDLNQEWENAPRDKYDIFVISIVLHQVMDSERGAGAAAQTIKSAVQATKPGGFITWSDVGSRVYIQSGIIPFNVSDREGCVPENIFEHISIDDVRVPSKKEGDVQYYKVPRRLSQLRSATPESVAAVEGSGIYESNIFEVVELPEHELHTVLIGDAVDAGCEDFRTKVVENLGN